MIRLSQCFVEDIKHYKRKTTPQHEFVTMTLVFGSVSVPPEVHKRLVVAQRELEREGPQRKDSAGALKYSSDASRLLAGQDVGASNDTIVFTALDHTFSEDAMLMRTVLFPEAQPRPNLIYIIALVATLSSVAPRYRLYSWSCYFFAANIVANLIAKYPYAIQTDHPSTSRKMQLGKYLGIIKSGVNDNNQLILPDAATLKEAHYNSHIIVGLASGEAISQNAPEADIPSHDRPFVVTQTASSSIAPVIPPPVETLASLVDSCYDDLISALRDPAHNSYAVSSLFLMPLPLPPLTLHLPTLGGKK